MKDVIDMLLQKQATLEADKAAEKALACEKIDAEYAERSEKINALLDMAGYVPPVEEVAETEIVEEAAAEVTAEEIAPAPVAEVNTQVIY